jgi:hypothetical protein
MADRTSQLSRIAQSPPATDLRGGKASDALSTVRRNNLAAEDAVFFQSDSALDVAAPTRMGPGTAGSPAPSVRGGNRNGAVHVLSDSPSCNMEGVDVIPMSDSDRGGSTWPARSLPEPSPSWLDPRPARSCACGCRLSWPCSRRAV